MRPTAFVYRPALATDAVCRRCGGSLSIGAPVLTPFGTFVTDVTRARVRQCAKTPRASSFAYHVPCAIDVCAEGVQQALKLGPASLDVRSEWLALAAARVDAKIDANRKHKKSKANAVAPATDPVGRPRVRVLFLSSSNERGDGIETNRAPIAEGLELDADSTLVDTTVTSTLREYVLVRHEDASSIAIDPSQPFVAGLYWQKTTAAVAHAFRHKLVEWRALGIGAPVLAVVGPNATSDAHRDYAVQQLRSMLEKAGFDPNDAPVVSSVAVDAAFIDALGLALDERTQRASGEEAAAADERAIANLQRIVREKRDEAYPAAVRRTLKYYHRSSSAGRAQMLDAVFEGARTPALAAAAVSQFRDIVVGLPRPALTQLARVMLTSRAKLPATFDLLVDYWRVGTGENQSLVQLFIDTVRRAPKSQRAQRCAEHLEREADAGHRARVQALLDDEPPQSPVREALAPVLAAIDARSSR